MNPRVPLPAAADRPPRKKLERQQLRIKGNVIACNEKRFAVSDDVSEDLFVASDADEYSLLGGEAEGLILELADLSRVTVYLSRTGFILF